MMLSPLSLCEFLSGIVRGMDRRCCVNCTFSCAIVFDQVSKSLRKSSSFSASSSGDASTVEVVNTALSAVLHEYVSSSDDIDALQPAALFAVGVGPVNVVLLDDITDRNSDMSKLS